MCMSVMVFLMSLIISCPVYANNNSSQLAAAKHDDTVKSQPDKGREHSTSIYPGMSNSLGMKFVYIPPGTFMMGSRINEYERRKNEEPHQVTLAKGFYLQTTEVTQGQWFKVTGSNPAYFKNCGDDCPVENVSWKSVQGFLKELNNIDKNRRYRLPTEAEWEYACRARSKVRFSFGDDESKLGEYAWYLDNSNSKTHPAGQKQPNKWGLSDMHGNVSEWCQDWYGRYNPSDQVSDPTGLLNGLYRVFRGGSGNVLLENTRCAAREWESPGHRGKFMGFRCILIQETER